MFQYFLSIIPYWLGLSSCRPTEQKQHHAAADHFSDYIALTQKALSYQADFDLDAWSEMLAPNVEYTFPYRQIQTKVTGKKQLLFHWKKQRPQAHIKSIQLTNFHFVPLNTPEPLPFGDLAGVYVLAMFTRKITFLSGQILEQTISLWCHFNPEKRIDRIYDYNDASMAFIPTHFKYQTLPLSVHA